MGFLNCRSEAKLSHSAPSVENDKATGLQSAELHYPAMTKGHTTWINDLKLLSYCLLQVKQTTEGVGGSQGDGDLAMERVAGEEELSGHDGEGFQS